MSGLMLDLEEGQNSNIMRPVSSLSYVYSHTGRGPVSNMVIVDVKVIPGFIPLKPVVKKISRC